MGFQITCKTTGKCCCYSTWCEQRTAIILETIKYLEIKIIDMQKIVDQYTVENEDTEPFSTSRYCIMDYAQFIKSLKSKLIDPVNELKPTLKKNDIVTTTILFNIIIACKSIKDAMMGFNVYGLYLFCNQSDCSGGYSVGEAYDIVTLFEILEPTMDKNSKIYELIYTMDNDCTSPIIEIFRESVNLKCPIMIT